MSTDLPGLPFAARRVPEEHDRRVFIQQELRLRRVAPRHVPVHEDDIFDEKIAARPEPIKKLLDKRYGSSRSSPRKIAFIDRIVADSRDVPLNHTAGLSLPRQ